MNGRGFFAPMRDRPAGNKSSSGGKAASASAGGKSSNRFASFNPLSNKTQTSNAKSFSLGRPASTSFLAAPARFHRPQSDQGSGFLKPPRVQTAPPIALAISDCDQESPQDANEDEEEESNASNSSHFESPESSQNLSDEQASAEYLYPRNDDLDEMMANKNNRRPQSDGLLDSYTHEEGHSRERSSGFAPSQADEIDVVRQLEKCLSSVRTGLQKRLKDDEQYRNELQAHRSQIDSLKRDRRALKHEIQDSSAAIRDYKRRNSDQDAQLKNLDEEYKIALDDISSLTRANSAMRLTRRSEARSFEAIVQEKEHEAAQTEAQFQNTLDELSYLQTKLQDEAELKMTAKQEASIMRKQLDEALNKHRMFTEEISRERIQLKSQVADAEKRWNQTQETLSREQIGLKNAKSMFAQTLAKLRETESRVAALDDGIKQHKTSEELLIVENRETKAQVARLKKLHEEDLAQLESERQIKDQQLIQWTRTREQLNGELLQKNKDILQLQQRLKVESDNWREVRNRLEEELTEKNREIRALKDRLTQETSKVMKNQEVLSKELSIEKKTSANTQKRFQELLSEHKRCRKELESASTERDEALCNAQDAQRKLQDTRSEYHAARRTVESAARENESSKRAVEEMARSVKTAFGDIEHLRTSLKIAQGAASEAAQASQEQKASFQKSVQEVLARVKVLLHDSSNSKRQFHAAKVEMAEATRVAHNAVMERTALVRSFDEVKHRLETVQEEKGKLAEELERERATYQEEKSKLAEELERERVNYQEEKSKLAEELEREKAAREDSGTKIGNPLQETAAITRPRKKPKVSGKKANEAEVGRAKDIATAKRPSSSLGRRKKRKILDTKNVKSGSSKAPMRARTVRITDEHAEDAMFEDNTLLQ